VKKVYLPDALTCTKGHHGMCSPFYVTMVITMSRQLEKQKGEVINLLLFYSVI